MIGLYAIVNKKNGMAYIGSSDNVKRRLIHHKSAIKNQKRFANTSFLPDETFNVNDFKFLVIGKAETITEARELETAFLETNWGSWLYNKSPSAQGSVGIKRDHDKYSAGAKKQWDNPEQRAKKMAAMRGKRKILTCPHCGTIGGGGNMSRYHFEKCKLK
jgi:hypothetical protein